MGNYDLTLLIEVTKYVFFSCLLCIIYEYWTNQIVKQGSECNEIKIGEYYGDLTDILMSKCFTVCTVCFMIAKL